MNKMERIREELKKKVDNVDLPLSANACKRMFNQMIDEVLGDVDENLRKSLL